MHVRLYGRKKCCLCDEAEAMLRELQAQHGFSLEKIDIDGDADLSRKLGCQIPVATFNGGQRVALRFTPQRLQRALELASKRVRQSTL